MKENKDTLKPVLAVFISFVAFIILMNISLKVFNTMDAWLGIGMGFISICVFAYTLYRIWKKSGQSNDKNNKNS